MRIGELVYEVRKSLLEELSNKESDEPILLRGDPKVIDYILFDCMQAESEKSEKKFFCNFEILRKLDFSNISFNNVNVRGFNFSGFYNVTINPQKIYKKDLSGSILDGVTFDGSEEDMFRNVWVYGANFTGSKKAVIDPQTIAGKNMFGTVLTGVTFKSSNVDMFDDVWISDADFTGSKGAIINPYTVAWNSIKNTNMSDTCVIFNDNRMVDTKTNDKVSSIENNSKDLETVQLFENSIKESGNSRQFVKSLFKN